MFRNMRSSLAVGLVLALAVVLAMAMPSSAFDRNYVGAWSATARCDDDMTDRITRDGWSGTEFSCKTLRSKREKGGWRVNFTCAAEGENYAISVHWRLLKNGRLRQSIAGRKTVDFFRCEPAAARNSQSSDFAQRCLACFNEAQQLGRSVGGFCRPDCADVFMTMVCDSKGTDCKLPD